MRIPGFVLTHRVDVRALAGTTARGAAFADPVSRRCHYEERAALKIDMRTDSPTSGTEITMYVQVITQLEHYAAPGSRITLPTGTTVTVANARKYSHAHAPSNAEMWCV